MYASSCERNFNTYKYFLLFNMALKELSTMLQHTTGK